MFIGRDGFYWWIGVVEDIEDPQLLGRAKIRIFGYHSEYSKGTISTEDLPWGIVILPPNSVGNFSRLVLGEWVFGFFLDGPEAQEPAILGYLPTSLIDGAVTNAQSFGRYPTTSRTFSNLTTSSTLSIEDINFQLLSQRKSFFSNSGHSLQFLDHPNQNFIDIRHNNGRTALRILNGDVAVEGDSGNFNLTSKIKELEDSLKRVAGDLLEANEIRSNFEFLTLSQFSPAAADGTITITNAGLLQHWVNDPSAGDSGSGGGDA